MIRIRRLSACRFGHELLSAGVGSRPARSALSMPSASRRGIDQDGFGMLVEPGPSEDTDRDQRCTHQHFAQKARREQAAAPARHRLQRSKSDRALRQRRADAKRKHRHGRDGRFRRVRREPRQRRGSAQRKGSTRRRELSRRKPAALPSAPPPCRTRSTFLLRLMWHRHPSAAICGVLLRAGFCLNPPSLECFARKGRLSVIQFETNTKRLLA